jgi:hypothetical protein
MARCSQWVFTVGWTGSLFWFGRSHCFWFLRTKIACCGLTMRKLTVESLSRFHPCPPLACRLVLIMRIPDFWDLDDNSSFAQTRALLYRTSYRSVLCLLFGLCLHRIVPRTRTQERRRCIVYAVFLIGYGESAGYPKRVLRCVAARAKL